MGSETILLFLFFHLIAFHNSPAGSGDKITMLTGDYYGQPPPGMLAEKFAPDMVSIQSRYEYALHFAPNGREFIFTVQDDRESESYLMYSKRVKQIWTEPKRIKLSNGQKAGEMEAFYSHNGRKIFFAAYDSGMDVRIWQTKNKEKKRSDGIPLESALNDGPVFYPSCSDKRIFYTDLRSMKICSATKKRGVYSHIRDEGIPLGGHPFVAPDEGFLLLDGIEEGNHGKRDIYVVVKKKDGSWTKPVNLGIAVNTGYSETCPTLSHDGAYLFFSRYNDVNEMSDIYWIDASIISQRVKQELNPAHL